MRFLLVRIYSFRNRTNHSLEFIKRFACIIYLNFFQHVYLKFYNPNQFVLFISLIKNETIEIYINLFKRFIEISEVDFTYVIT